MPQTNRSGRRSRLPRPPILCAASRAGWTNRSKPPGATSRAGSGSGSALPVPQPPVLILDDSSSALDFATDAALRRALRRNTGGMTVFIVSQRAAAVQRADRILVLDDGRLVGSGTHADLLARCPVYKEICLSQLSREEVDKTL